MGDRQGGGLTFWVDNEPNLSLVVDGCTFENNRSSFGGGVHFSIGTDNCSVNITNSEFEGNKVVPNLPDWGQGGGGLMGGSATSADNLSISIDSCLFHTNSTTENFAALGIRIDGTNSSVNLSNSTFTENENSGFYATTAIWNFGNSTADVTVENCLFEGNFSSSTGEFTSTGLDIGSYNNAGPANFIVRNCKFLNNHTPHLSAALLLWGDVGSSPVFTVEDCLLEGNSAGERAGALWIQTSTPNFQATMNRCQILNNHSPWGAAIAAFIYDITTPQLPPGAVFSIENSLIAGNTGDEAVIALDSFPDFRMVNVTVVNNSTNGIQLENQSGLTLQNTILYNNGATEFEALTGDVTVTSDGGNLIGDGSLAAYAHPSYDLQNADPLFAGSGGNCDYYQLSQSSPAIGRGMETAGTADLDLCGNERVRHGQIDVGALESPFTTSAKEAIVGELGLSPNPATTVIRIRLPENVSRPVSLQLFDAQGRLVRQETNFVGQEANVERLPNGIYLAKGVIEDKVYVGRFVKQ